MWYWIIGGGALLWWLSNKATAAPVTGGVVTEKPCTTVDALLNKAQTLMFDSLVARGLAVSGGGVGHDTSNPNKHYVGVFVGSDVGLLKETKYLVTFEFDAFGGVMATTKSYGTNAPSIAAMCELLPTVIATL